MSTLVLKEDIGGERLASRIGKSVTFTTSFYIDKEIDLMILALAIKKRSNKSQIVREAVIEKFEKEFGTTNVQVVARKLGIL